jgi:6,7-dimethyl-8-ribityllumazine synthase
MKKIVHVESIIPNIKNAKIAILRTKWYAEYIDSMVLKCLTHLAVAEALPEVYTIPGAVELPLAAQTLARMGNGIEAIICFGGIVKGDTLHFEMISNECMRGLGEVMLQESLPIIIEVISVLDIQHLADRAGDNDKNKGIEAAYAAAEIIAWRRSLK